MSFFSEASLAMIPSGYKTSKVYSALPITGDGDLTFSRSNDTATRVGPDGLIEKVRTNLALRSQEFATSAVWSTVSGTITNNAGTAPDGTNTASKIVATDADPYCYQPLTLSGQVAISCYVKGIGSSIGKTGSIRGGTTYYNFTITGDWQRVLVAHTAAGAQNYGIETPESAAVSDEVLLWGFQVETGDIATDYIATTTAAVTVGPVANVPRLDYLDSSSPRLLLEPQRTNLVPNSEQFDNATWSNNGILVANQGVSPDGYTNADLFYSTTGSGIRIFDAVTITSATTYTSSVFAKASGKSFIWFPDIDNSSASVWFNLSNGTFSTPIEGTATMVDYGNGWYRCSLTTTSTTTTGYSYVGISDASGSIAFTQNGTDGVLIWGAQLEEGAYGTSYIPTLGAAVTRGSDLAQKTSASALIGQTEGTIFWEFEFTTSVATDHECALNIDDGSFGNTIYILKGTAGLVLSEMYNGAVLQASFFLSSQPAGTYKAALGYANNNTAFFLNGVQVGTTDTSCSVPATSRIQLGNGAVGASTDKTAQVLLFPTRLSNADLAALTA